MQIKIKKLKPDTITPNYAFEGDVGLDLYSLEDYILQPWERKIFDLGFALEFPIGYAAIVKDKGGMAKKGIHTMGGVYDAGYRGEYVVQLLNVGNEPYHIKKDNKIAQLIIFPVAIVDLEEVNELSKSERADGRFGSSGE